MKEEQILLKKKKRKETNKNRSHLLLWKTINYYPLKPEPIEPEPLKNEIVGWRRKIEGNKKVKKDNKEVLL